MSAAAGGDAATSPAPAAAASLPTPTSTSDSQLLRLLQQTRAEMQASMGQLQQQMAALQQQVAAIASLQPASTPQPAPSPQPACPPQLTVANLGSPAPSAGSVSAPADMLGRQGGRLGRRPRPLPASATQLSPLSETASSASTPFARGPSVRRGRFQVQTLLLTPTSATGASRRASDGAASWPGVEEEEDEEDGDEEDESDDDDNNNNNNSSNNNNTNNTNTNIPRSTSASTLSSFDFGTTTTADGSQHSSDGSSHRGNASDDENSCGDDGGNDQRDGHGELEEDNGEAEPVISRPRQRRRTRPRDELQSRQERELDSDELERRRALARGKPVLICSDDEDEEGGDDRSRRQQQQPQGVEEGGGRASTAGSPRVRRARRPRVVVEGSDHDEGRRGSSSDEEGSVSEGEGCRSEDEADNDDATNSNPHDEGIVVADEAERRVSESGSTHNGDEGEGKTQQEEEGEMGAEEREKMGHKLESLLNEHKDDVEMQEKVANSWVLVKLHACLPPFSRRSRLFNNLLLVAMVVYVLCLLVDTLPRFTNNRNGSGAVALVAVEAVAAFAFLLEYVVRILGAGRNLRWAYVLSMLGLVDLLAWLAFVVAMVVEGAGVLEQPDLRAFGLVSIFKLVRGSNQLTLVLESFHKSLYLLVVYLVLVIWIMITFGAIVYFAERGDNRLRYVDGRETEEENPYTSILMATYWAIITATTVGYGDITPVTPVGRAFAAVCSTIGVISISLPTSILLSNLQSAYQERMNKQRRLQQLSANILAWAHRARVRVHGKDYVDHHSNERARMTIADAIGHPHGYARHFLNPVATITSLDSISGAKSRQPRPRIPSEWLFARSGKGGKGGEAGDGRDVEEVGGQGGGEAGRNRERGGGGEGDGIGKGNGGHGKQKKISQVSFNVMDDSDSSSTPSVGESGAGLPQRSLEGSEMQTVQASTTAPGREAHAFKTAEHEV